MARILKTRVTKYSVDRLLAGEMIRDTDLVGFGVRRQKGPASYFLQKRIGQRIRWITIGRHGAPWTPESARKEAYRLLGQIVGGDEPRLRRQDLADKPTLAEAAQRFLEEHGARLRPSTLTKYRYLLKRYIVPELGDRLIERIARPDVLKLHGRMAKKPPIANYSIAVLSKLMSWAEEYDLRPPQSNPCFRIKKFRQNTRQRYLSTEEYGRLGAVLARVEKLSGERYYQVAAIKLLLFTGARLNEILTLTWKSVDLQRNLLLLPDSKTGQKVIRLNAQAADIIRALPKLPDNPHVIIGRIAGSAMINLQDPWQRIRKEAGIPDVRLHDLRHSFASVAAGANGSLPLIGGLLGHSQFDTTARYAHLAAHPLDALNARVGHTIAAAIGMAPESERPNPRSVARA